MGKAHVSLAPKDMKLKDFLHKTFECGLVGVLLAQAGLVSARTRPNLSFIYQIPAIREQLSKKELRKLKKYKIEITENRKKAYELFTKLYQENPELAEELGIIPDYGDNEVSDKDLEALVNMSDYYFESKNPKIKEAFREMLDVGIKGKRAYCSLLEALKWLAEKYEFKEGSDSYVNDPLSNCPLGNYNLPRFIFAAWDFRGDREKERWSDFKKVTNRLSSPELVNYWVFGNIEHSWEGDPGILLSPKTVFRRKKGDCDCLATFAAYCLDKSGYDSKVVSVIWNPRSPTGGHSVATIKTDEGIYMVMDFIGPYKHKVVGPFEDYNQVIKKVHEGPTSRHIETYQRIMSRFRRIGRLR